MASVNRKIDFIVDENGCFICTSHARNTNGYPRYQYKKKALIMSRYIYEECFGQITGDLIVRHKCDNPACINPEHLELGTYKDNAWDRELRGRGKHFAGEKHFNSKLTEKDVLEIVNQIENGKKISEIARNYCVNESLIYAIRSGNKWNSLTGRKNTYKKFGVNK